MQHIQLICQFGRPARGISPYGDALLSGLKMCREISVEPIDYISAYPHALHPVTQSASRGGGELHWASPMSWYRVARRVADIVHIQHWSSPMAIYLWPLAVMSRRFKKKIVITVHNPEPHESIWIFDLLERKLLQSADTLIVHDSNGAKRLRERLLGAACNIRVVPHMISIGAEKSVRLDDHARLNLKSDRRYIVLFGNLRGYKGTVNLLRAWNEVSIDLPGVDLIIAGRMWDGRRALLARVVATMLGSTGDARLIREALKLPNLPGRVHLYEGFLSDPKVDALLRLSEMAIFPYERFSSQSGAASRAAGMGCPVLVSDLGGLPDLAISREWVVRPGDVRDLADKMFSKLAGGVLGVEVRKKQLDRIRGSELSLIARQHANVYACTNGNRMDVNKDLETPGNSTEII